MKDNYGILPYPKLDDSQKDYHAGSRSTHNAFSLLITTGNEDAAGAVMEALAASNYQAVMPAYFETALKVKYTRDDDSARMFDLIRGSLTHNFGYIYSNAIGTPTVMIQSSFKNENSIASNVKTDGGVLVFNPHSFVGSAPVSVDGETRYVENIPAKGYAVVTPKTPDGSVVLGEKTLENKFLKVTFDENFNMVSIYDKDADREVIDTAKGPGNQLEVYEDYPRDWDAWEISNYYRRNRYTIDDVTSVEPVRDGARAGFKVCRRFLDSTVEQHIWMYEDVKKIDFETVIDWKQDQLMAKVAFPVTINSNRATYEVQFGTLERPTHSNTSWDAAKFEVCAHKYCDFAEYGYGVAMLNDCKYGHDIHDGVMRLTLLKSPTYPNEVADRCMHYFTYSIAPHQGDHREAGIVRMAYDLNKPMTAVTLGAQEGKLADSYSLVSVSAPNVILETVKKAEDSDAMVLRMYEAYNQKCNTIITLGFTPKRVTLVGLMEDEIEDVPVTGNTFKLSVKPFEIVTVKVQR